MSEENSTLEHIERVKYLMKAAANTIQYRGTIHDASKLDKPEKELFELHSKELKNLTYDVNPNSEYMQALDQLRPALIHHYQNNSHHPEHYPNGIDDMNLFDIIEMFMDWKASTERHDNGNIMTSIDKNQKRFNMSDQLVNIFKNTVRFRNWVE